MNPAVSFQKAGTVNTLITERPTKQKTKEKSMVTNGFPCEILVVLVVSTLFHHINTPRDIL